MAILPASQQQYRYSLQPGESLSVVTDAVSSCRYGQLPGAPSSPDVPAGGMIAVAASSTVTLGPRSDFSRWLIDLLVGPGVNVTQNTATAVADSGAPADLMHMLVRARRPAQRAPIRRQSEVCTPTRPTRSFTSRVVPKRRRHGKS